MRNRLEITISLCGGEYLRNSTLYRIKLVLPKPSAKYGAFDKNERLFGA